MNQTRPTAGDLSPGAGGLVFGHPEQRLAHAAVLVHSFVPGEPTGLVRPEQLCDRQWWGLVEVDARAEEVVVPAWMDRPDGDFVAIEDVPAALIGLEWAAVPYRRPSGVGHLHRGLRGQAEHAYLWTAECVPEADGVAPIARGVTTGHTHDVPAVIRDVGPTWRSRSSDTGPPHSVGTQSRQKQGDSSIRGD